MKEKEDILTTKSVNEVILRDNVLNSIIYAEMRDMLNKVYKNKEDSFFKNKWIPFSFCDVKGYYNTVLQYVIPVQVIYDRPCKKCFGKNVILIEDKKVIELFDKDFPVELMNSIQNSKKYNDSHWVGIKGGSYSVETERFSDWNDDDSISINIVEISLQDFKNSVLSLDYKTFHDTTFDKVVSLLKGRKISEISETEMDSFIKILSLNKEKIKKEAIEKVMTGFTMSTDRMEFYTEELLTCDTVRAELEKYDKKCLEDINSGHWELWETKEVQKGQARVKLEKNLIARNPIADIHNDGLIGIDFGTKSTIVSKQDGREKTSLMRIGIGQLNKAAQLQHYENPTMMEFINLDKFEADYKSREGRPLTSINDLTVSHKANNNLKNCSESDYFYSYFYDIKQWCGDTERKIKIIDQKGKEKLLPAFLDLDAEEFNPLELYAYYLGLYINNMRNGIYLDYILSFPVTYKSKVKAKILESFKKGLRKSLPNTVLQNEKVMKNFRVRQGVSEPAAYAITALQGYGFEPNDDEKIFYSIFDFGGGTTDFDFGVWRCAGENRSEERYDYVIEHFGSEGDQFLGGENLLELMAFEIFKANALLLQAGSKKEKSIGFSFSKPKEGEEFPGSETLISNSQEARRNTKQLMEVLRPFWEGIIGIDNSKEKTQSVKNKNISNNEQDIISYQGYIFKNNETVKNIIKEGKVIVDLFDKAGNRQVSQNLYVNSKPNKIELNLVKILENRIEKGVDNFFDSIKRSFRNDAAKYSGTDNIQIFLAGNASKSPILKKCFEKYINIINEDINKKQNTDGMHFFLYPPLGTEEAIAKQKEMGISISDNSIEIPTGKTGVAYGLIAGREGGTIKVISEFSATDEAKFSFNLGKARRGKFQIVIDRNDIEYNKWERFIDAGVQDFEIYYSTLPSANKMSIDDIGISKKRCRLSYVDSDADVYIRAISPDEIEYTISKGSKPKDSTEVIRIRLE